MKPGVRVLIGAIAVIAGLASFVASSAPDGLERVAADLGFEHHAVTLYTAPLPDYSVPRLPPALSGIVAGVLGTVIVGGVAWAAGRVLAKRA